MIWITVPCIITWLWTAPTALKPDKNLYDVAADFLTAAIVSGCTSALLWDVTTHQRAPATESPIVTTIWLGGLLLALSVMCWIKHRRAP